MNSTTELRISALVTVIPLTLQAISAVMLYDRNFRAVSGSKDEHLNGVHGVKVAVRGQIWLGGIVTLTGIVLLVVSWCYRIEPLQKVLWGTIILTSSFFQISSLPEETLSASGTIPDCSSYNGLWHQKRPLWRLATIPLLSFAMAALIAATLRIALPAFWPDAWAMWMTLGCLLSMARSFRHTGIFGESGNRWKAYTLVSAGCIILGTLSWARSQASTRAVLLGANHLVLLINRIWTMHEMDRALGKRQFKSMNSSGGGGNKGEV